MAFSFWNIDLDAELLKRRSAAVCSAWLIAAFGLALVATEAGARSGGGIGGPEPAKSTLCEFFSGPRKGSRGSVFPARPIGAPCHDDAGNNGVTVSFLEALPGPIVHPDGGLGLPTPQPGAHPDPPHIQPAVPHQPAPQPVQQPVPQAAPQPVPQNAAPQPVPHVYEAAPDSHAGAHTQHAAVAGGAADLDGSHEQSAYDSLVGKARNGTMPYYVPNQMTVGEAVTVRVDLLAPTADPGIVKFAPTGSAPLKVSPLMQVTLSQPDNPDAFTIVADPVQSGSQTVPDDGKAEWTWKVTARQGGNPPKVLQIDAYMMLNEKLADGEPFRSAPIHSATVPVPVLVMGFWLRTGDFLANNWTTLLGYVLPSGAGAALLIFFLNRRKAKAA